jgi:hypothetical protein
MPHLLTSNDEPDTAAETATEAVAATADLSPTVLPFRRLGHARHRALRPRQFRGADPEVEPLRRQAVSIIEEVLAGSGPEEAEVREQLKWHVANNPGRPEKALLEHLMSVGVRQDESA